MRLGRTPTPKAPAPPRVHPSWSLQRVFNDLRLWYDLESQCHGLMRRAHVSGAFFASQTRSTGCLKQSTVFHVRPVSAPAPPPPRPLTTLSYRYDGLAAAHETVRTAAVHGVRVTVRSLVRPTVLDAHFKDDDAGRRTAAGERYSARGALLECKVSVGDPLRHDDDDAAAAASEAGDADDAAFAQRTAPDELDPYAHTFDAVARERACHSAKNAAPAPIGTGDLTLLFDRVEPDDFDEPVRRDNDDDDYDDCPRLYMCGSSGEAVALLRLRAALGCGALYDPLTADAVRTASIVNALLHLHCSAEVPGVQPCRVPGEPKLQFVCDAHAFALLPPPLIALAAAYVDDAWIAYGPDSAAFYDAQHDAADA